MKFKKLTALLLAGVMAFSTVACGGSKQQDAYDANGNLTGKLIIWTLASDLEKFGD